MEYKIHIAMISVGGGHSSPARALENALKKKNKDYSIFVSDFWDYIGEKEFDTQHKNMWAYMLKHTMVPRLCYYIQDFGGALTRSITRRIWRKPIARAVEWFKENPPDLFISTHFLNVIPAYLARKKYPELKFPIALIGTDPNDISALWIWKKIDYLIVFSNRARIKSLNRGFSPKNIRTFSYPVRKEFVSPEVDKNALRERYGIDPGKLTLMISSGSEGRGKIEKVIGELLKNDVPCNCLVVCGRNREFYESLHNMKTAGKNFNLVPFEFLQNINEIIAISDFVVIKAGAASTYESLVMHKPIIFYDYVSQNEKSNINFALRRGLGWHVRGPKKLVELILAVIKYPVFLNEKRDNFFGLDFSTGAAEVAQFLDEIIESHVNFPRKYITKGP